MVGLAKLAGGGDVVPLALGLSMLLLQFSIGAANDFFDVDLDASTKPSKPIPSGLVSRRAAAVVATLAGGGGLALALWLDAGSAGAAGSDVFPVAGLILAVGMIYDAWLKRTPWAWLAFAVAFPLLPLFAWYGAVGHAPPGAELLLPVAFLAGPTLQLANGLVDLERDRAAGVRGLPEILGRPRAWSLMAGLQLAINGLAIATILADSGSPFDARALVLGAAGVAAAGVALSASWSETVREWGWRGQAVAIALLAFGWLLWRVAPG